MQPKTPTVTYGDSYPLGQIAQMWEKPTIFVRRMIDEGKLATDGRGLVASSALRNFYLNYGSELRF